jgi:hypothetical protein
MLRMNKITTNIAAQIRILRHSSTTYFDFPTAMA